MLTISLFLIQQLTIFSVDSWIVILQETVYLSFQANGKNKNMSSEYGQTSNGDQLSAQKDDSSQSPESQLALDEAIARSLQLGDDFEDFCRDELNSTVAGNFIRTFIQ